MTSAATPRRPRLGVLGLVLDAYEPLFPGITARQEEFLRSVLAEHEAAADFDFPAVATTRAEIDDTMAGFSARGVDGVVVALLTYAPGQHVLRAVLDAGLPVALVLIQPEETVRRDVVELDLTVNQAIHGSQDVANTLLRGGVAVQFYAGSRTDGRLAAFLADFGAACAATAAAHRMRIGAIGALTGMGDIITDEMALFRRIGPQVVRDAVGDVYHRVVAVDDSEVAARVAWDREHFAIDPVLSEAEHAYAVRLYLGLRRWLDDNDYAGYTAHYEDFGADGRFEQLPLLAASHLMADGYGYAAEGDVLAATLVTITAHLFGESNFTEMYMFDLERDAILFAHAGEGNWRTAGDRPRIIHRVLTEGGLGDPPTPLFTPRAEQAAIASLVHLGGEAYRLVVATGRILDPVELPGCDMPSFFFRPDRGAAALAEDWMRAAGAHHQAVVLGDALPRLRLWCAINDVELVAL